MAAKDKGRKRGPSFRDRQRFPESSSPYKQLRLLLQGSMPLVHSKLRAMVYQVRSLLADIAARLHVISLPRRAHTALFLAGSLRSRYLPCSTPSILPALPSPWTA